MIDPPYLELKLRHATTVAGGEQPPRWRNPVRERTIPVAATFLQHLAYDCTSRLQAMNQLPHGECTRSSGGKILSKIFSMRALMDSVFRSKISDAPLRRMSLQTNLVAV
jgi:hypothetical protein